MGLHSYKEPLRKKSFQEGIRVFQERSATALAAFDLAKLKRDLSEKSKHTVLRVSLATSVSTTAHVS